MSLAIIEAWCNDNNIIYLLCVNKYTHALATIAADIYQGCAADGPDNK